MSAPSATGCESVLNRYRGYLRMLAESKLDRRLRAKIDPSDIVQETMMQAFRAWGDLRGSSEGERLAWLRQILIRTLLHAVRDFGRAKRNVAREQPLVRLADQSSVQLEALCVGRPDLAEPGRRAGRRAAASGRRAAGPARRAASRRARLLLARSAASPRSAPSWSAAAPPSRG